jgi:hypothetical protein
VNTETDVENPDLMIENEPPENVEPPKKRRGRKPMPRDENGNIIRDGKTESDSVTVSAPKKRGRKKTAEIDKGLLARQIVGLHQIGAMVSGIPQMAISGDEASVLAEAVANVAAEYDLAIDGKTGALLQLAFACASVYGPRIYMVMTTKKATDEPAIRAA